MCYLFNANFMTGNIPSCGAQSPNGCFYDTVLCSIDVVVARGSCVLFDMAEKSVVYAVRIDVFFFPAFVSAT